MDLEHHQSNDKNKEAKDLKSLNDLFWCDTMFRVPFGILFAAGLLVSLIIIFLLFRQRRSVCYNQITKALYLF